MLTSLETYEMQARLCQAMSHATRLQVVHLLRDSPRQVDDLVRATGLSQGSISRHLAILRNNGVIIAKRQGQHVAYHLADPRIVNICDLMREMLAEQATHQSEIARAMDE